MLRRSLQQLRYSIAGMADLSRALLVRLNAHYSISDQPLSVEEWQRQYATSATPSVTPIVTLAVETPTDQAVN